MNKVNSSDLVNQRLFLGYLVEPFNVRDDDSNNEIDHDHRAQDNKCNQENHGDQSGQIGIGASEFNHRSSNSNSPRTMMKILRKDLPTSSNDSDSFPKWMMKKAKVNAQMRMTNDRAVLKILFVIE